MTESEALTRWFHVEDGEVPALDGVYEATVVGIPGEGGTLQEGFYFWNGQRWGAMGVSPNGAYEVRAQKALGTVRHWRGRSTGDRP